MSTKLSAIVFSGLAASASLSFGQKATERYIPIGKSPGLSNKVTIIGEIAAIDTAARTITVGARTIKITNTTQIWVDRSRRSQTNQEGTFADLKKGIKVECKMEEKDKKDTAEWIKVEATS